MQDIETRSAVDQLRRNDSPALRAAFARIPRAALLAILNIAGIGSRLPSNLSPEACAYENGMRAMALEILTRAGFDIPSILGAAITGHLEGDHHDRHDGHAPILDDDAASYGRNDEY
ncbi:hypothetical protein [Caulobacter sp. X]|uniref:hypothetical protein n=1 Tax=Caulobacter sp. X TaxID=2048901 RepID=UPI000C14AC14|nr:hypothetical protein [Caulobacter sp. X]PIB96508.1 hypothetical protein CSW60_18545 [Caulobacter sp. X]